MWSPVQMGAAWAGGTGQARPIRSFIPCTSATRPSGGARSDDWMPSRLDQHPLSANKSGMTEPVPADVVTRIWSRPFERPDSIPESAEVVIIRGGIIGVSTAGSWLGRACASPCAREATSRENNRTATGVGCGSRGGTRASDRARARQPCSATRSSLDPQTTPWALRMIMSPTRGASLQPCRNLGPHWTVWDADCFSSSA